LVVRPEVVGMATALSEDLWLLDLGLVPPLATNGYLLDDGDEVTLVDPGLPWNRPSIGDELASIGYELDDVSQVIVTHYDLDHAGGLRAFSEFDGPVYMGAADVALATGEDDPSLFHHKGLVHRAVRGLYGLPDGLDVRSVEDGDTLGGFTAYHTPGHNPGHTVYRHESGVAFLGDLVWEEGGELTPPFWLDSYDMRAVRESIRDVAERLPAFEVAAMAHGTPLTTDGDEAVGRLARDLARR
jgi:glyoxylase-like metal-dependent hydrolase (beta-lactamase superfamily II)